MYQDVRILGIQLQKCSMHVVHVMGDGGLAYRDKITVGSVEGGGLRMLVQILNQVWCG